MYQSFQFLNIQWGSEYSKHLNTRLVWYSNGKFVSGCQTVPYSNGGRKTELKKPVTIPKHGITVRAQIVNIWILIIFSNSSLFISLYQCTGHLNSRRVFKWWFEYWSVYCICLVSIWWWEYWTKNNWLRLPPKPKKPSWRLLEETLSGSYHYLDPTNKILIQPLTI